MGLTRWKIYDVTSTRVTVTIHGRNQRISNYLKMAMREENPKVGLGFYCRHANESLAHEIHYELRGFYPDVDGYRGFSKIIKEIEGEISEINRSKLWKVADLGNRSAHHGSKSDFSPTKKHVEDSVENIISVYSDFFGSNLDFSHDLDPSSEDDSISKGIENDLRRMEIPDTPGRELLSLGIAADLRGRTFHSEGYYRQAIQLFQENKNKR